MTDPQLQQFVDTFRHNVTYSPEFGTPVDGQLIGIGEVAAAFGATKSNSFGTTVCGM